jgi:site-specific DNA recombinase
LVAKTFGKEVRGDWQPLIDEETFARVQAVLKGKVERIAPEPKRDDRFPLRGFLLCTQCGLPATASESTGGSGRLYRNYRCHRSKGHLNARADKAEADFLRLLESLTPRSGQAALLTEVFRRTWNARNDKKTELEALTKRLDGLKARKERILLQMEDGTLSSTDFKSRYKLQEQLINAATANIAKLKDEQGLDVDEALDYLSHLLWNSHILWETSDLDTKQRIQKAIFPNGLRYDPTHAFGTVETELFQPLLRESVTKPDVVTLGRFELPTCGLGNRRSIHLSYRATCV